MESSRRQQVWLVLLSLTVTPNEHDPLELQRRIVDDAIHGGDLRYVLLLCGLCLPVPLVQGGLKYMLNVYRGGLVERIALHLRERIFGKLVGQAAQARKAAGRSWTKAPCSR